MPIDSGTSVMRKTRAATPGMEISSLMSRALKYSAPSDRYSGTVITDATLDTAVIDTLSATSPRARCVSRFAVVPPGNAPRRTTPTASRGSP